MATSTKHDLKLLTGCVERCGKMLADRDVSDDAVAFYLFSGVRRIAEVVSERLRCRTGPLTSADRDLRRLSGLLTEFFKLRDDDAGELVSEFFKLRDDDAGELVSRKFEEIENLSRQIAKMNELRRADQSIFDRPRPPLLGLVPIRRLAPPRFVEVVRAVAGFAEALRLPRVVAPFGLFGIPRGISGLLVCAMRLIGHTSKPLRCQYHNLTFLLVRVEA